MHFTIFWLINYGEGGRRGFRLQGKGSKTAGVKHLDMWDPCTKTDTRITGHSKETATTLSLYTQSEWEQKFPEVPWLANSSWEGFPLAGAAPQAVPWTAGAGPADRLPPCPCPPCSGSCRRAGGGCTRPDLQDTQGTMPVSAGPLSTATHRAMTRVSDNSKRHREKATKTLREKTSLDSHNSEWWRGPFPPHF